MGSPLGTVRTVASSLVFSRRALPRIWRLQVKREIYLSGVDWGKKKHKRARIPMETAKESADAEAAFGVPLADGPATSLKIAVPKAARASAVTDVTFDALSAKVSRPVIDEWTHTDGFSHDQATRSSPNPNRPVVRITSLLEMVRMRREQASRTLLFVPDLAHATNPCPRYMRHKIETLAGRVRHTALTHTALTSLVAASKSDAP